MDEDILKQAIIPGSLFIAITNSNMQDINLNFSQTQETNQEIFLQW
jgi:hypothetical protein